MTTINLKAVKHSKGVKRENHYCGPAALSSIMGITAEAAARRVRAYRKQYRPHKIKRARKGEAHGIVGCQTRELRYVLEQAGYRVTPTYVPKGAQVLSAWDDARSLDARRSVFLIRITGHFIVVKGDKLFDSYAEQGSHLSESTHRRSFVREALMIEKI